ncbi:hypothetical protein HRbin32_00975 [bacterium HR32]|nr:hypothetical protein HRbin32_00975 [bacterium HR32]
MWYPLMEMGFHWGVSRTQNSKVSITSFMLGRGGTIHSFWAMNSLRQSFWMVPRSFDRGMPRRSATATYMAYRTAAGALMVMEVLTSSRGIPSNRTSMSARVSMATPSRPTSPSERGWSES